MLLYNVTDKALPKQDKPLNLTLKKAGIILEPGGSVDVQSQMLGQIAAWVQKGWVHKDELPAWYSVEPEVPEAPEPSPSDEGEYTFNMVVTDGD